MQQYGTLKQTCGTQKEINKEKNKVKQAELKKAKQTRASEELDPASVRLIRYITRVLAEL